MANVSDTSNVRRNEGAGNTTRRYDSTRRRARAAETRQAILDAGRDAIVELGYGRATMREVADRAGVALETVYSHFRAKPVLLTALLDTALGGAGDEDDERGPVAERAWVRRIGATPDARATVSRFVREVAAVHAELAPLLMATRAAAGADEAIAEVWAERTRERYAGMASFAERLAGSGELRAGLDADGVRDELFTLSSPEVYGLTVREVGWTPQRYTDWLTETLTQRLFG